MIIGIDASRANRCHRSGTEWYSYYLIREIAKLDSQNEYVLYSDKPLNSDLADLISDDACVSAPKFDKDGNQIIRSPHNNFRAKILNWPFSFFWTQGRLSLEMLIRRPDMLFVPSHTLPIIHPRNSVITIHDIGFERDRTIYKSQPLGPEKGKIRFILNLLVKLLTRGRYSANTLDYLAWSTLYGLKNARRIITVSEFSAQEIRDVYSKVLNPKIFDKIRVIHNGYNDKIFKDKLDETKITEVLDKHDLKKPYIFYLGRIERKKNIPRLIEAFSMVVKSLPDVNLALSGAASFGFDEVQYLISEFNLDDNIIKTGWVEESDLPYLYAGAELFVFPSLYEGFGIPLIEAMACGTPVCCSDAPAITEVVDGAGLVFDAQSAKNMADTIINVLTDPKLKSELVAKGFNQAKQFSWRATAEKTLKVLTEG